MSEDPRIEAAAEALHRLMGSDRALPECRSLVGAVLAAADAAAWRPVKGWEGRYEVSACGQIRRVSDNAVVGQWPNDQGYMLARLSEPRRTVRVHRLVAEAFIERTDPEAVGVNHLNHQRGDNRAVNLEWATQAQNLEHMTNAGRRAKPQVGKRSPTAKLSDDQVSEVRRLREDGFSFSQIASLVGCSKRTAERIIGGQYYKGRGLTPQEQE